MPQPPACADPEATGGAIGPRPVGAAARHVAGTSGTVPRVRHPSLTALLMLNSSPSAPAAMGFASGPPGLIVRWMRNLNRNTQLPFHCSGRTFVGKFTSHLDT